MHTFKIDEFDIVLENVTHVSIIFPIGNEKMRGVSFTIHLVGGGQISPSRHTTNWNRLSYLETELQEIKTNLLNAINGRT